MHTALPVISLFLAIGCFLPLEIPISWSHVNMWTWQDIKFSRLSVTCCTFSMSLVYWRAGQAPAKGFLASNYCSIGAMRWVSESLEIKVLEKSPKHPIARFWRKGWFFTWDISFCSSCFLKGKCKCQLFILTEQPCPGLDLSEVWTALSPDDGDKCPSLMQSCAQW